MQTALNTTAHSVAIRPAALTVSWIDLTAQRSYPVAYARRKLMDPALSKDLVHDVFEAVVSGRAVFGGRAGGAAQLAGGWWLVAGG